jgi:UDP-2-acetamido-3-amino-2,3-dideoxy-glucuronate N-acetyltransferase
MARKPQENNMNYYVHPMALVESKNIGKNSRIWAFAHILPKAVIGEDCNICDHTFIENDVVIGNRVTIKCGVQIWDGITIEEDVFIGPNVTFTNDPFPRSKRHPSSYARTLVCKGASIGANATILPGLTIGQSAMIGAGSVVTKDVPPFAIVAGNPVQIIGYAQTNQKNRIIPKTINHVNKTHGRVDVKGVQLFDMPIVSNLRGNLVFAEFEKPIPFIPKRYFFVFDVPNREVRGEHAHRECQQFLICMKGSCSIVVDDGRKRAEIFLDRPNIGLLIPPMVWATEYKYSEDALLMVIASDIYKAEDYIRDYDQYLAEVKKGE